MSEVLSLLLLLVGWIFNNQSERKEKAKKIAHKLKKITKEGDILYDQVREEMSQQSDTDWEDIPIRESTKEEL